MDTLNIAEHFYDIEYLRILYNSQYKFLRDQIRSNIITSVIVFIIFFITLIATFTLLENKALSLIPLFSLFVLSVTLMFMILNIIRYNVITKVIEGEMKIDHHFLKLLILKKKHEDDSFIELKKITHNNSINMSPRYK
jgi:hypothetical protein